MHDMSIMMQCNLSKLSGIKFRHTHIRFKLFYYTTIQMLISMAKTRQV
jgi:hypothetical protein